MEGSLIWYREGMNYYLLVLLEQLSHSFDFIKTWLQVIDIIASHPKHHVIIGIDTLGKEDLLVHIARMLKIKVC